MILRFGDCELDTERYTLRRRGRPVVVQPRVLDLLIYLVRAGERVVSRAELHETVWQGVFVSETALSYAIKEARRAIGDDGSRQALIQTIRGRGFRLLAPVSQGSEAPKTRSGEVDPFVGRGDVMAALQAELEGARQGAGRLVLLEGEPGIGKSRTLRELAALARARGFRVLIGRGVEGVDAPDYWPWTQALRELLESADRPRIPAEVAGVVAQMMPALGELLPEAAGQPSRQAGDVREARFHLFDALARTCIALARRTPVLLAFDDLHRADAASLSLLAFVLREVERVPVLVLGTCRGASFAAQPERTRQLGELLREPRARSFELRGLERAEVAALVSALRGAAPTDAELDEMLRRTRGNPFFVREILTLRAPAANGDGELPETVRQAVLRHLDALPPSCRALLSRAAVLGRRFELDVVAALDGLDGNAVVAALDAAIAARIVEVADPSESAYQFVHALICEALAAELPASELRNLHARAAHALGARATPPADGPLRIAQHLLSAVPAVAPRVAVAACRRAAEHARARLAHDEAASLLEQAAALLPADGGAEAELELLFELADAQRVAARLEAARATCARAAKLARLGGDARALARAALGFAGEQDDPRVDPQVVDTLDEALVALGPGDSTLRARLQSRLAEAIYHGPELARAGELGRDAVAMARRCGDPLTLGHALKARHWSAWAPDNLEEREAIAAELLELADRTASSELADEALAFGIHNALERGDRALLEVRCEEYAELTLRSRRLFFDWHLAHYRVMRHLLAGDTASAEGALDAAARLGRQTGYSVASTWSGVQLYGLRRQQGRLGELEPVMRRLARQYPLTPWRLSLACEDVRAGRRGEGLAALRECLGDGVTALRRDLSYLATHWFLADLCAELGAAREARLVESALEPFADRHVVVGIGMLYLGPVAHALGLAARAQGRERDAQLRFEDARRRDLRAPAACALAS